MNSKRGGIGSFISLFVATIFIVVVLLLMIVASGFVKKVAQRDNFGVQNETATGLDDIFGYADGQFGDIAQLRIVVYKNGDWDGWLTKEMGK